MIAFYALVLRYLKKYKYVIKSKYYKGGCFGKKVFSPRRLRSSNQILRSEYIYIERERERF